MRPGKTKSLGTDQKPVLPLQERFLLVLKHKEREWLSEGAWALPVSGKLNQLQILWAKDEFLHSPHTSYSLLFLPPFLSPFLLPLPPSSLLPSSHTVDGELKVSISRGKSPVYGRDIMSILQPHKQTICRGLVPRLGGAGRQESILLGSESGWEHCRASPEQREHCCWWRHLKERLAWGNEGPACQ